MMSFPSKQKWWSGLSKAEKAIYSEPDSFFRLCSVYISRYQGNLFMAKNAHKAIYEGAPVPMAKTYEDGCMRVEMFNKLKEYAYIRDIQDEKNRKSEEKIKDKILRDWAIDILNIG